MQHGLRAYTPAEQKAVRAAASAFRANPAFNTEKELMALGTGEALVSFLDEKGIPSIVEKARILPPQSLMGNADDESINAIIVSDEFELKYRDTVDAESAYEIICKAEQVLQEEQEAQAKAEAEEKERIKAEKEAAKEAEKAEKEGRRLTNYRKGGSSSGSAAFSKAAQKAATSAASSVARSVSTNMVNSVLGGKTSSAATIGKRAATNALSSVMRTGTTSIIRGLFGTKK